MFSAESGTCKSCKLFWGWLVREISGSRERVVLISTSDILRLQEAAMGDPRSQEEFWGQTGFWEAGLGAGPLSSPPSHLPVPSALFQQFPGDGGGGGGEEGRQRSEMLKVTPGAPAPPREGAPGSPGWGQRAEGRGQHKYLCSLGVGERAGLGLDLGQAGFSYCFSLCTKLAWSESRGAIGPFSSLTA